MSGWLHTPSGALTPLTLPCRHYFIKDLFRRRESFRSSLFRRCQRDSKVCEKEHPSKIVFASWGKEPAVRLKDLPTSKFRHHSIRRELHPNKYPHQISPWNTLLFWSKLHFWSLFLAFWNCPLWKKTRDSVKSLNSGFTNNKCQKCHEFRGTYIDYHRFLAIPFCHATNCNSSPGRSQCAWLFDSDWLNDWKLMVSHIFSVGILEQKMRKIEE